MALPLIIAAASAALKVGSELASYAGEKKEDTAKRREAVKAYQLSLSDLLARRGEERQSARQRIREGRRTATGSASLARTAAGESGVTGRSVDLLIGDIERQRGEQAESVRQNLEITERQLGRQARGLAAQRDARIRANQGPSLLATGLKIGGVGLGFAADRYAQKA